MKDAQGDLHPGLHFWNCP